MDGLCSILIKWNSLGCESKYRLVLCAHIVFVKHNLWHGFGMCRACISHPSDLWLCFRTGTGQDLVPVGGVSEDTILEGGNIQLVNVSCATRSIGLRARDQVWPILFGSIGIAVGVFNWSFVCWIFQFGAVHPLFCVSNAQCRHPHLRGWIWCYELASFSLTCWKYHLLWTENSQSGLN